MGISVDSAAPFIGDSKEGKDGEGVASGLAGGLVDNDEREEGEIVDDFEDIISSDEELSMRKRIEELEARNLELEKIATISGIYNTYEISKKDIGYKIDRYQNGMLSIDLSDLEEYQPPPIYTKKHKTKSIKNKLSSSSGVLTSTINRTTNSYHTNILNLDDSDYEDYRIHKRSSPLSTILLNHRVRTSGGSGSSVHTRTRKRKHERSSRNRSSRKSVEKIKKKTIATTVATSSKLNYSSSDDDNECFALNRDELRIALKRDHNFEPIQGNLKNLIKQNKLNDEEQHDEANKLIDENIIKTEPECINIVDIESDDSVSLEEQELRLIALKSAVVKKHLQRKKRRENDEKKPYSPTDFLHITNSYKSPLSPIKQDLLLDSNNEACNSMDISPVGSPEFIDLNANDSVLKPVDMDIVDSNNSNTSSPIFMEQTNLTNDDWLPIEQIPLPNTQLICETDSNHHNYNNFINKIHSPKPIRLLNSYNLNDKIDKVDNEKIEIKTATSTTPEPTDDEENALRELLLATMNSPKKNNNNNNNKYSQKKHNEHNENETNKENNLQIININNDNDISLEAETLRNMLLTNMKKKSINKTEFVLKEALKRIKNRSQHDYNESSSNSDEFMNDNNNIIDNTDRKLLTSTNLLPEIGIDLDCMVTVFEEVAKTRNLTSTPNIELIQSTENHEPNNRIKNENTNLFNNNNSNIDIDLKSIETFELTNCLTDQINNNNNNDSLSMDLISETNLIEKVPEIIQPIKNKQNDELTKLITTTTTDLVTTNINKLNHEQMTINSINKTITTTLTKIQSHKNYLTKTIINNQSLQNNKNKSLINIKETSSSPTTSAASTSSSSTSLIRKITNNNINNNTNTSTTRLITTINVPIVNQMVINVGKSDSETDDDLNTDNYFNNKTQEKSLITIENDYFDNASPMSLQMDDSPCDTPICTTPSPLSPLINSNSNDVSNIVDELQKLDDDQLKSFENKNEIVIKKQNEIDNNNFQVKLDEFLKNARTKVDLIKKETTPTKIITTDSIKSSTPLAVRHLPPSSQLEYRRLVNRMKILEKQKQAKNPIIKDNFKITITNIVPDLSTNLISSSAETLTTTSTVVTTTTTTSTTNNTTSLLPRKVLNLSNKNDIQKDSLIKKVLKKNITTNPLETNKTCEMNKNEITKIIKEEPKSINEPITSAIIKEEKIDIESSKKTPIPEIDQKHSKMKILSKFENEYKRNSASLLENITKTLNLVKLAKDEKLMKFKLELEVEQLRQRLKLLEENLNKQNKKISKIYPEISSTHSSIVQLKAKSTQLNKMSTNLGKTINGDDYKLNCALQKSISDKSQELSKEIKKLKNLKKTDVSKICESLVNNKKLVDIRTIGIQTEINDKIDLSCITIDNDRLRNDISTEIINDKLDFNENIKENDVIPEKNKTDIESTAVKEEETMETDNLPMQQDIIMKNTELNMNNDVEIKQELIEEESDITGGLIPKYVSPLDHRNNGRLVNPNGVLCPYELMGQCDDKECQFEHFSSKDNKTMTNKTNNTNDEEEWVGAIS